MNQKLLSEINVIANEIVDSNDIDVPSLKMKISKIYEKLTVLEFLENSINNIELSEDAKSEKIESELTVESDVETIDDTLNSPKDEEENIVEEKKEVRIEDIVEEEKSSDKTIEELITEQKPIDSMSESKHPLHEELKKSTIQIGLNDRIAFVKRLFDGNQQDFHRVLSQVNTFSTFDEVKEFIDTMVRPEYNWDEQEEYSERFMELIEIKFQ